MKHIKKLTRITQAGPSLNTGARDLLTGRALFRGASASDDAAHQLRHLDAQQRRQAQTQSQQNQQIIDLLGQLVDGNARP